MSSEKGETFVVVSDSVGFVGAFNTLAAARDALRPYLGIPFVYCAWRRHDADTSVVTAADSVEEDTSAVFTAADSVEEDTSAVTRSEEPHV